MKAMKKKTVKKKTVKKNQVYEIGKAYLVQTVTLYYTGKLIELTDKELIITDASWIADTGRFHNALKNGTLNEVEPCLGAVIIGRGAIVSVHEWNHELPKEQK